MFVLIKAPYIVSFQEETVADSNTVYSPDDVASSHILAASGLLIYGNAMNGLF